jgi:hypothetical protein
MHPIAGAELQSRQADSWCLWIMPGQVTSSGARWQGFLLEADLSVIIPYLTGNNHSLEIVISDIENKLVSELRVPVAPALNPRGLGPLYNSLFAINARLKIPGQLPCLYPDFHTGYRTRQTATHIKNYWVQNKKTTHSQINVFFSAYSISEEGFQAPIRNIFHVFPYLHIEQKFPISVDLLRKVESIKAEVKWNPPAARGKR